MKISEPVLVDTNILVYAHNQDSLFHSQALHLIHLVLAGEIKGILTEQNLLEFYAIITDPRRVTNPLATTEALKLINNYLNSPFEIILPTKDSMEIILSLCKQKKICGSQIFDAFLVATMLSNQVKTIITLNVKDFMHFIQIEIIDLKKFDNPN